MNNYSGILYSKNNYELSFLLQNICKQNKINFFLISRFPILIEHIYKNKPNFLFLDKTTIDCSEEILNIFSHCSQLSPDHVILIYKDEEKLYSLNKHFIMIPLSTAPATLMHQVISLIDEEKHVVQSKCSVYDPININHLLDRFGFSAKYLGSVYLKEVILEIIKNKSSIKSLNTSIYPKIAFKYNTTIASIERNIRTAVMNALNTITRKNIQLDIQLGNQAPSNKRVISYLVNQLNFMYDAE